MVGERVAGHNLDLGLAQEDIRVHVPGNIAKGPVLDTNNEMTCVLDTVRGRVLVNSVVGKRLQVLQSCFKDTFRREVKQLLHPCQICRQSLRYQISKK